MNNYSPLPGKIFSCLISSCRHSHIDEQTHCKSSAITSFTLQQPSGWLARMGWQVNNLFRLPDYSLSLLLASVSLKGSQNTEEERGEVFLKDAVPYQIALMWRTALAAQRTCDK